jgi:hypothetical protein
MQGRHWLVALAATATLTVVSVSVAIAGTAAAPPVGPLPSGPTSTIQTQVGQLVAVALPHRANGRVWRVARTIDPAVLVQVSEADIGANVVLVFKASGKGSAKIVFGLTRGEGSKAYEARTFIVNVR